MLAVKWAREKKVPFLGICLGFQVAVIEWARNVVGIKGGLSSIPLATFGSVFRSSGKILEEDERYASDTGFLVARG